MSREGRIPARITPQKREQIARLRSQQYSQKEAAKQAGVSLSFVKKMESGHTDDGKSFREAREREKISGPIPYEKLSPEAKRAWNDIQYFALRYFGAILMPWHVEATEKIVKYAADPAEKYVVVNCPPGAGKSYFFGRILPAWLTVRDRGIRGMIVSNAVSNAKKELVSLRRMFETPLPVKRATNDIKRGLAVDAESSLVKDYGLFRPLGNDERWAQDAFQVEPFDGFTINEKEPTWQAWGQQGRFLGNRLDLIIADDVWDKSAIRTIESREVTKTWYDDTVETRLEPGGLLVLVGQRQSADDVYRHCLDKLDAADEYDEFDEFDEVNAPRMYEQIIFKSHYEEHCQGDHGPDAKPHPEGCLLYPGRLSWKRLNGERIRNLGKFEVLYQQKDIGTKDVLVDPLWVTGGVDPVTREEFIGCLDNDRGEWMLPKNLDGQLVVWASADPSPTQYWSVQCWAYHPMSKQRFLLCHYRGKMGASDFLDYNLNTAEFTGLMESWRIECERRLNLKIGTWIVEQNAAQKWLLGYNYANMWRSRYGVALIRHDTHTNKADPKLGIQSLKSIWRNGNVRLPNLAGDMGRLGTKKLVDEVTVWPEGTTDDAVMSHWFGEFNLSTIYSPKLEKPYQFPVPSWAPGQPPPSEPRFRLRRVV